MEAPKPFLTEFIGSCMKRKLLLSTVFVSANLLTWLVFSFVPPSYEASALVQVDFARRYGAADNQRESEGLAREEQYLSTQALIIHSERVIRDAIDALGPTRLYHATPGLLDRAANAAAEMGPLLTSAIVGPMRAQGAATTSSASARPDALTSDGVDARDKAFLKAYPKLFARPEAKTNLIRVSFSHSDAKIAAEFVNRLVQSYLDRHVQLLSLSSGASFMEAERKKYETQFNAASSELNEFSTKNKLYSVDEQQQIILARRKDLQTGLTHSLEKIAQVEAEIGEYSRQLVTLKLNTLSPQLATLSRDSERAIGEAGHDAARVNADRTGQLPARDPPLLLVRVYQDTAQSLVKSNAELMGLRRLATEQKADLAAIDFELSDLSRKRARYDQLKRNVELARHSADSFAREAVEQRTDLALGERKLLRLEVVQEATAPLKRTFPSRTAIVASGLVLSIIAMSLALARSLVVRRRHDSPRAPWQHLQPITTTLRINMP